MTQTPMTSAPGGFVPQVALCFTAADGTAAVATAQRPLPVTTVQPVAASTPLGGTASGTMVAGPFTPDLGRPIWLTLAGSWTGSVTVQRSTDGGTTRAPLTVAGQPWAVFTGNAQEVFGVESVAGATYYLTIALTAGTLSYQVQQ